MRNHKSLRHLYTTSIIISTPYDGASEMLDYTAHAVFRKRMIRAHLYKYSNSTCVVTGVLPVEVNIARRKLITKGQGIRHNSKWPRELERYR